MLAALTLLQAFDDIFAGHGVGAAHCAPPAARAAMCAIGLRFVKRTVDFEDRFAYVAPDGAVVHVRGPFETDLASVPPQLWSVIASYGRQTLAAGCRLLTTN